MSDRALNVELQYKLEDPLQAEFDLVGPHQ